jgi:hypothetical protein
MKDRESWPSPRAYKVTRLVTRAKLLQNGGLRTVEESSEEQKGEGGGRRVGRTRIDGRNEEGG